MCWVRGPSWRTGRSLVRASMANHNQRICLALRSLVRSSSNCTCGICRLRKQRSCMVCACEPARVNQVVMVACRLPKIREAADGSSPSASAESTMATCWEGGFRRYMGVLRRARERGAALLAAKRLDRLSLAMLAIPNQRVELIIGVAEVGALRVRTSEAHGGDALRSSSLTFHLTPGTYRRRRWPSTRRGRGGETTGR